MKDYALGEHPSYDYRRIVPMQFLLNNGISRHQLFSTISNIVGDEPGIYVNRDDRKFINLHKLTKAIERYRKRTRLHESILGTLHDIRSDIDEAGLPSLITSAEQLEIEQKNHGKPLSSEAVKLSYLTMGDMRRLGRNPGTTYVDVNTGRLQTNPVMVVGECCIIYHTVISLESAVAIAKRSRPHNGYALNIGNLMSRYFGDNTIKAPVAVITEDVVVRPKPVLEKDSIDKMLAVIVKGGPIDAPPEFARFAEMLYRKMEAHFKAELATYHNPADTKELEKMRNLLAETDGDAVVKLKQKVSSLRSRITRDSRLRARRTVQDELDEIGHDYSIPCGDSGGSPINLCDIFGYED